MARGVRWVALVSVLIGTASVYAGPAFAAASSGCRSHTTLAPWGRYPVRRWTPIRLVRQPATIDDDGLRIGDTVEVVRDTKYKGRLEILKTAPDRAVGRVDARFQQGPIQEGDRVATRLNLN